MNDQRWRRWRWFRAFSPAIWAVVFAVLGTLPIAPHRLGCWAFSTSQAHTPERQPAAGTAVIRYAKGFTLEYHDGYKVLQVLTPWRDARVTFTYILVPRGRKVPDVPPRAMVVETPVRRMAAATTGCIPFLPLLHVEEALVGFSGCKHLSTPEIAEMVRQKKITEIGIGEGGMAITLNMEQLYVLQPEMVVVYGTGLPEYDLHPKLMEAGFKTVIFSSYMETVPLGRTEWIKFIAAFFDKEAEAEKLFNEIARQYETEAARVSNPAHRPTVFSAIPYRGMMYVPGGGSYTAGFVRDAGADYMWRDDTSLGAMPLNVENIIERAREADIWLEPGACRSLSELEGVDERFSVFKAFRTGRVYNNDAKLGPNGGNDFWETGEVRPDLVLKDLISIFHPDLLPSYQRIWYRQLPAHDEGAK